jgi:hypothetical protein
MRPFVWILAFAVFVSAAIAGCRSSGGGLAAAIERSERLADTSSIDTSEATVRVENTRFADLVVYIITEGGMRIRIGTAQGNNTTVLVIPKTFIMHGADLRFFLDPIGGGKEELSDKIYVLPGDEVILTLTP